MRGRIDVEDDRAPSAVDRMVRVMAGPLLRDALTRIQSQILETWHRAWARAIASVAAAALLVTAVILLVRGGLLGLVAIQIPPAAAYLGMGAVALGAALLLLKAGSGPPGRNLH